MARAGKRRIEGPQDLGKEIRRIRKELGLTLVELADRAGLSPSHVSEIETGKTTNPGVAALHKITTALGCDLSLAAGGDKPASASPSLVYSSPFTIEELQRMSGFESQALQRIRDIIEDPYLSREQRRRITEMIVSLAEWLRNNEKTEDR